MLNDWTATTEYTDADMFYVAAKMHPKTCIEICTTDPDRNPYEILKDSVAQSNYCYLAKYRGEPFAFTGLKYLDGFDIGWLITTDLIRQHQIGFIKASKKFYEPLICDHSNSGRILQAIQSSYVESIRYFEFLGYRQRGVIEVSKEPFTVVMKETRHGSSK